MKKFSYQLFLIFILYFPESYAQTFSSLLCGSAVEYKVKNCAISNNGFFPVSGLPSKLSHEFGLKSVYVEASIPGKIASIKPSIELIDPKGVHYKLFDSLSFPQYDGSKQEFKVTFSACNSGGINNANDNKPFQVNGVYKPMGDNPLNKVNLSDVNPNGEWRVIICSEVEISPKCFKLDFGPTCATLKNHSIINDNCKSFVQVLFNDINNPFCDDQDGNFLPDYYLKIAGSKDPITNWDAANHLKLAVPQGISKIEFGTYYKNSQGIEYYSCPQIFEVNVPILDTVKPIILKCPANSTVTLDTDGKVFYNLQQPTFSDNCGTPKSLLNIQFLDGATDLGGAVQYKNLTTYPDAVVPYVIKGIGRQVFEFVTTDAAGNSASCTTVITSRPEVTGVSGCWESVSTGALFSLAKKSDGTLWSWGGNDRGQLGDGTNTNKNKPIQISMANFWKSIWTGFYFSFAIKNDGTLWAWGANSNGQLGNGTNTDSNLPIQVGTDADWKSVAAGNEFTIAIKTNGTLWAWGLNNSGQLGDGTNTNKNVPVQIGTATNWQSVAANGEHSHAIKSDGTLWAWGFNGAGQMGDGTNTNKNFPVQIGTATNWKSISKGANHNLAVKSDGTLWAWGTNNFSQLGDGTTTNKNTPVQIGTGNNWQRVAAGRDHSIAISSDGAIWAWGRNNFGQLGDSTNTNRISPVQVGTASNWQSISSYRDHNLAIKSDGTLWAWGRNDFGQSGDGTTSNKNTPTEISSCTFIADTTPQVIINSRCMQADQSGLIPVSVKGFEKIIAMEFTLHPANANISLESITNPYFTNILYNKLPNGDLKIVWDDATGQEISLPDSAKLFDILVKSTAKFTAPVIISGIDQVVVSTKTASLTIIPNSVSICEITVVSPKGRIADKKDKPHFNAKVSLSLSNKEVAVTNTRADGSYTFNPVPATHRITPSDNSDIRKGVNVADVSLVRRHTLSIPVLTDNYSLVAADVNKDGVINIADVSLLNRIVLQIINEFPNNSSWRFLPKKLDISSNPLKIDWPDYIDMSEPNLNYNSLDFISIKVGDVNGSALSLYENLVTRSSSIISIPDTNLSFKSNMKIPVRYSGTEKIGALTMKIKYDKNILKFVKIESSSIPGFGTQHYNEKDGTIIISYDHPQGLDFIPTDVLMNLVFENVTTTGLSALDLSDVLFLNKNLAEISVVSDNGSVNYLTSSVYSKSNLANIQSYPNPFTDVWHLDIQLNTPDKLNVEIMDITGRSLRKMRIQNVSSIHRITINDLDFRGLINCKITSSQETYIVKAIKL